jgi:hypothetical protein
MHFVFIVVLLVLIFGAVCLYCGAEFLYCGAVCPYFWCSLSLVLGYVVFIVVQFVVSVVWFFFMLV